jgi:amino acid transporter
MSAVLPSWLVTILFLAILVAQFICGLATVTSTSRMLYAFGRDGGVPVFSKQIASVSTRFRTPVIAIWTGAVLEVLFVWLAQTQSVGGTNIYTLTVNATLIFVFLSFAVPIVAGFFAIGTPKWPKQGPWTMGIALYKLVAVLVVLSMALIIFIAIQPPNGQVLWITLAFLALAAIIWFAFENKRFQGPPVGDIIKKKQAEIAAIEAKYGEA